MTTKQTDKFWRALDILGLEQEIENSESPEWATKSQERSWWCWQGVTRRSLQTTEDLMQARNETQQPNWNMDRRLENHGIWKGEMAQQLRICIEDLCKFMNIYNICMLYIIYTYIYAYMCSKTYIHAILKLINLLERKKGKERKYDIKNTTKPLVLSGIQI